MRFCIPFIFVRTAALVLSVLPFAGCQAFQVERKTVSMASNLSEIQYRQVLDDLALLADHHDALPHFALTDAGRTMIQTSGQASTGLTWSLFTTAGALFNKTLLSNTSPGAQYIRQDLDEWDTAPALDPIQQLVIRGLCLKALGIEPGPAELLAMRALFQPVPPYPLNDSTVAPALEALGRRLATDYHLPPDLIWSLANYKPAYAHALYDVSERVGCGWVHVGSCHDVPKDACHVGRHAHTCVWVMPYDVEYLTNLTIAVLDVATTDTAALAGKTAKQASPKTNAAPAVLPH